MKNINSSERLNGKISVENWYAYRDEAGKIVEEISPIFFFIFFFLFSLSSTSAAIVFQLACPG